MIAIVGYRSRRRIGFAYGLAATVAVIAWFVAICSLRWGPAVAQLPVSMFMIVFALACIPGCTFCISEAFSLREKGNHRFQFGVGTMLLITFFLAIYLGILRTSDVFTKLLALWSSSK
jgi:hypothetical protein